MSTNAYIGYYDDSTGQVVATYCHYDGYIEGVGNELATNYNNSFAAEAVASVGYLSGLYETISKSVENSVHKDDEPMLFGSIEEFLGECAEHYGIEYAYLWVEGQWFVMATDHRVYPAVA